MFRTRRYRKRYVNYKINGKLCRSMKKDQLIAVAISKGIMVNDSDTIKTLCDKLQNKPNTPNTPNSLANEMEQVLIQRNRADKNKKRKLNESGIKNDLIKLYGKKWMSKYGSVMDLNKNVRDVKNQLNKMEKSRNYNKITTSNGILKKAVANDIKKAMVKDWKSNQEKVLKRKIIEKEAQNLYGKFGKNIVNNVVKYVTNLPKTPPLNSNKVKNYIRIKRELQQKPPLALKNKRKTK